MNRISLLGSASCNLVFKSVVHYVVSGEEKLFIFALKSAVKWQNMLTCNSSIIINQKKENFEASGTQTQASTEKIDLSSLKKNLPNHKFELIDSAALS